MTRIDSYADDILIHWDRITADLFYTIWYGDRNKSTKVSDFGNGMNRTKFFCMSDDVHVDTHLWTDMCHISTAMASDEHNLVTLSYENDYGFTYHITFHVGLPIVHVVGHLYATYMLKGGELVTTFN